MIRTPNNLNKKNNKMVQQRKNEELNIKEEIEKKEIEIDLILSEIKSYVNLYFS